MSVPRSRVRNVREPYSVEELRRLTLARQFPADLDAGAGPVALYERAGPVQSQTARSVFVGAAARAPGTTHAALTTAYERHGLVRGSVIRGTVHTATPGQHRVLHALTRLGLRRHYLRTFALDDDAVEQVWSLTEEFAASAWRSAAELSEHLRDVVGRLGGTWSGGADPFRNSLSFAHGGLIRRPSSGGWDRQTRPEYRTASAVLPDDALPPPPDDAVDAAVLGHMAWHGPATRRDLAWWSGLGLRVVDAALVRVASRITTRPGPAGVDHHDVLDPPPARDLPGVRLLPEFDAVLCGYDPKARDRFVTPEHHGLLWNQANGLLLPPLLVDGRVGGTWRLQGTGRRRVLHVIPFAGCAAFADADLSEPAAALATALDLDVAEVVVLPTIDERSRLSAVIAAL